jgi:hypothetical protein
MPDPYLIPGTDVLRNKFNILDSGELERRTNDVAIAGVDAVGSMTLRGPPVNSLR